MSKSIDEYQLIIEHMPERIFWKDKNNRYIGANQKFLTDAGVNSVDDLIGKTDFDLIWTKEQAKRYIEDDNQVMSTGCSKLNIHEQQTQYDGIHWLDTSKVPLRNSADEIIGTLGMYRDITNEKKKTIALAKMALVDKLTELPNRVYLENIIDRIEANNPTFSCLLLVDLDYFKTINDSWGHHLGDILLKKVALKLQKLIAKKGVLASLGGDEFAVFVQNYAQKNQLELEITKLSEDILSVFKTPFKVEDNMLYIGASIGASFSCGNGINKSKLFRHADLAMYQAKSKSRNAYAFYSKEMTKVADLENEMLMQLRQAVDRKEFHLVYQPQFDVNEKYIGAEALMRWKQPDKGLIPPDQFIPLAEKSGLIHQLGGWLLKESKRIQAKRFLINKKARLSINISPIQFRQDNFVSSLICNLLDSNLPAYLFEIEITESLLLDNPKDAFDKLKRLREHGFTIAIDDFGTGYSSLSYLSKMPIDKLKIDRSFVMQLFDDEKNQIIIRMILQMAHSLGIQTVAEGVESRREFEFLKENKCDIFQGFYFSKPIQENDFNRDY